MTITLKRLNIKNYRGLRDVELPIKQLTILTGANASGKSSVLSALNFVGYLVGNRYSRLSSSVLTFNGLSRNEGGEPISIALHLEDDDSSTTVDYRTQTDAPTIFRRDNRYGMEINILEEQLSINDLDTISVENGQGVIRDEENPTRHLLYRSKDGGSSALSSATSYGGEKPVATLLQSFIEAMCFYDLSLEKIRFLQDVQIDQLGQLGGKLYPSMSLLPDGSNVQSILYHWYHTNRTKFDNVSRTLFERTGFLMTMNNSKKNTLLDVVHVYLSRKNDDTEVHISQSSDGVLRLIAYLILLNQDKLPSLIAIESPEQDMHPSSISHLGYIFERLSARTQVIITTHSASLLSDFHPDAIGDELGVLFLENADNSKGTQVIDLEERKRRQPALSGWIEDFGIGSAVFDSALLSID